MKKTFLAYICLILVVFTSCTNYASISKSTSEDISTVSDYFVVDENEYYQILQHQNDSFHLQYKIFNQAGQEVMEETVINHPLTIEMVNDDIVGIYVGYGTGVSRHQYYSVINGCFSDQFYYTICFDDSMIAYLKQDDERQYLILVIQNAFDSTQFYKEFPLNVPVELGADPFVVQAKFNFEKTKFFMEYYASKKDVQESIVTSKTFLLYE